MEEITFEENPLVTLLRIGEECRSWALPDTTTAPYVPLEEPEPVTIIGQTQAKTLLSVVKGRSVLMLGPPGCGKTTLARWYLYQFGPILFVNGSRADKQLDIITQHDGPVLIDEAHRMDTFEALYPLLDRPLSDQHVFAFTTTDPSKLPGPLKTRLVTVSLSCYNLQELTEIGKLAAPYLSHNVRFKLAEYARGSPRRVKLLADLTWRTLVKAKHLKVSEEEIGGILSFLGYAEGLTVQERAYMMALKDGPRSVSTLAGMMGTTIASVKALEAELIQMGLTGISGRGRWLTEKGKEVMKRLNS